MERRKITDVTIFFPFSFLLNASPFVLKFPIGGEIPRSVHSPKSGFSQPSSNIWIPFRSRLKGRSCNQFVESFCWDRKPRNCAKLSHLIQAGVSNSGVSVFSDRSDVTYSPNAMISYFTAVKGHGCHLVATTYFSTYFDTFPFNNNRKNVTALYIFELGINFHLAVYFCLYRVGQNNFQIIFNL